MMKKPGLCIGIILLFGISVFAEEIFVSPKGAPNNSGNMDSPLSFKSAIEQVSSQLKKEGLPEGGITINLFGGDYSFEEPIILDSEFKGSKENPIIIRAVEGEEVSFDGSMSISASEFTVVAKEEERLRLASSAADHILVTTISNKTMIKRFNENLMLNLIYNGVEYLPSVFPNEGYAHLNVEANTPEIYPPAIPVGKEKHGIRAGTHPFREHGKPIGFRGNLKNPRGARAGFSDDKEAMGGTWEQWENEIERNNSRNQLTGFIEANWLLSSQAIYAASSEDQCIHLTRVLNYGWAWRDIKPFRVFGLLCELDKPGEWHFDLLTNQLFLYPPEPLSAETEISISIANGFIELKNTQYVHLIGLSVKNVGEGTVYQMSGEENLIASCTVSNSTATGVVISGKNNSLEACNLIDLNVHVKLVGGSRSSSEIIPGNNRVYNCHFYQKNFKHEKVNIVMAGVGNVFKNNLIHNSLGQSMVIDGNDQLIEMNEFFNIGYDEGDGGSIYSGADLGGFGNVYRYNFFHHLMHSPGKLERSGIHLDDGQSGATCIGNVFYKSAAKGIHAFGGAGHILKENIFLEGDRSILVIRSLGHAAYKRDKEIRKDPIHHQRGSKEDYIGRVEDYAGLNGWASSPWKDKYPLFNKIMSDTAIYGRLWPIHHEISENYAYGNLNNNSVFDSRIEKEALKKSNYTKHLPVSPDDFVDYESLNFQFKDSANFPAIPFGEIGLRLDQYRTSMPDKSRYRKAVKDFFEGIGSMPGTKKKIDTSILVED